MLQNKSSANISSLFEFVLPEWFPGSNEKQEDDAEVVYHEVPLKNYYDLMYTAKVYIGRPQQAINAIWDTGSSRFLLET